MSDPAKRVEEQSRVDEHLKELAEVIRSPKELSGVVSGTSEETAALFNSGHTLAEDNTGTRDHV
jgi:hypothetical protein